ncbi:MAG: helix-turn-helix domain-containing protein [Candidatus Omnitrophota bacterium]
MKKEHNRSQVMSTDEVAKYLGVHRVTLYRLIKTTDIPVFKLAGVWRTKKDLLDQWLVKRIGRRENKGDDEKDA